MDTSNKRQIPIYDRSWKLAQEWYPLVWVILFYGEGFFSRFEKFVFPVESKNSLVADETASKMQGPYMNPQIPRWVSEEIQQGWTKVPSALYWAPTFIFGRWLLIKTEGRKTIFTKVHKSKPGKKALINSPLETSFQATEYLCCILTLFGKTSAQRIIYKRTQTTIFFLPTHDGIFRFPVEAT